MQSFRLSTICASNLARFDWRFNLLRRYAVIPTRHPVCIDLDRPVALFQSPTEICSHSDKQWACSHTRRSLMFQSPTEICSHSDISVRDIVRIHSEAMFQSPTEICSHSDSRYHFSSKITSLAILLRGSRISCRRFDFVIPALCFCMLITPRFSCTFSFARISPYFANSFDPRSPD